MSKMTHIINESMFKLPIVEGPIAVSDQSYPFCDMLHSRVPLNVNDYGYVEEEYFISGTANVYDEGPDSELDLYAAALKYKTRILVRKPVDISKFTGRVYFDIMNATQKYDIEDLWHRSYLWCMENGHAYVGITSKPVNVQALKNFDYNRYKSLDWTGSTSVPQPSPFENGTIPGTEEGLVWDMIGQTGTLIRSGRLFSGKNVDYICLTGQSQSGTYLNTFVDKFDKYLRDEKGKHHFDGYLNIAGVPMERAIRQEKVESWLSCVLRSRFNSSIPFIMVSTEGDLTLFAKMGTSEIPEDSDTAVNKCRYYEVAGSPHTDVDCPILSADSEILKAGRMPQQMSSEARNILNPLPLANYINGFLEKLYVWKVDGIAPASAAIIKRGEDGKLVYDENGNVLGGFRSPYVDIPRARYTGFNAIGDGISGTIFRFGTDKLKKSYGNKEHYLCLFKEYTDKQVADGWLNASDANRMLALERELVPEF